MSVVWTGRSENLSGTFASKNDAIEYIVERVRENSGARPEVKLEKACNISVPDSWTRSRAFRRVYVLLDYMDKESEGAILGFHTTCEEARKAIELRSRCFFEEGCTCYRDWEQRRLSCTCIRITRRSHDSCDSRLSSVLYKPIDSALFC